MSKGKVTFKELDVTRAINAARKAKLDIARVEVSKDGTITIVAGKPSEASDVSKEAETNAGEWDHIQ